MAGPCVQWDGMVLFLLSLANAYWTGQGKVGIPSAPPLSSPCCIAHDSRYDLLLGSELTFLAH